MSSSEVVELDEKGRLLIPARLRELLRLKAGSQVLVSLDEDGGRLLLMPTSEKKLVYLTISLSDAPGSLARAAECLAAEGVDLISSESRSLARGQTAEWRVAASADSIRDLEALRKKLAQAGAVRVQAKR